MTSRIERYHDVRTITLDTTAGDSEKIPMERWAGGAFFIPSTIASVTLTFHGAEKVDGTYFPMFDTANAAVTMTVAASRCYPLPDECFGFGGIKIVPNADDGETILLSLKG